MADGVTPLTNSRMTTRPCQIAGSVSTELNAKRWFESRRLRPLITDTISSDSALCETVISPTHLATAEIELSRFY